MVELAGHLTTIPRLFGEISAERLRELQRFAEVGRVSASLIHDISSPLTAAILHLEQEEQRGLPNVRHARRSIRVLERYLEAARQQLRQENSVTSFQVKHEIDQVKRIVQPLAQRQHIKLCFGRHPSYKLNGDPVKFQRILTNLIVNAMEAYREPVGQTSKPLVRITVEANRPWLIVRVQDWGEGVAAEQLPFIFEPFYTTKQPQATSGSGIGLSTVKRYVEEDFGGHVNIASSPQSGTEFRITFRLFETSQTKIK